MQIKEKINFITKLNRLFNKKAKQQFFLIMLVALIMSIFQAVGVASVFPFISLIMKPDIIFENKKLLWLYQFLHFTNTRSFIIVVGILIVGTIIIGNLISALAVWLKSRYVWRRSHDLSVALLRQYLSFPYSYFLNRNTADIGKNVLAEVQVLTQSFMIPIFEMLIDMVLVSFIFLALILISPLSAIVIFVVFCICYWAIYQFGLRRQLKARGGKRLKENTERFKTVSEALGGIKDIKILGREEFFLDKFREHSLRFSILHSWYETAGQLPRYFIEIVASGSVFYFIFFLMLSGSNIKQAIPMISFFGFAGYRLMPVMNRMFQAFTKLQFNKAVLDKIYNDLNPDIRKYSSLVSEFHTAQVICFEKQISFNELYFSYPGTNKNVLNGINLIIKKNTVVAIVGSTGCGKTTFIDNLLGLLTSTGGSMEIDGVKIEGENVKGWQKRIGYVPQYIYLSDDSIKRNIAFGLPENLISSKAVEKAAGIANLHDFIIGTLSHGYDTVVGERGIRLSGGQRQRVGIARALYNDPDVLVFDEATSSLDGITEDAVLEAIENISHLKTMIIIAHRLTTVRKCNKIYLLNNGRIAAHGTYEELMSSNAQFKAMANGDLNKDRS
jgi:ATP-binding cassette, subfamily B, bacterial PglK